MEKHHRSRYSSSSDDSPSPKRRHRSRSPRGRSRSPKRGRHSSSSPRRYRPSESREREPKPDYRKEREVNRMKKQKHVYEDEEDIKGFVFGMKADGTQVEELDKNGKKKVEPDPDREKPNFSLSGKLSEEQRTTETGQILKFAEPPEAKKPTKKWLLFPFKDEKVLEPIPIHRKSCYLCGRDRGVADIPLDHHSVSKQHAVIQFRSVGIQNEFKEIKRVTKPYIMDLESTNGTFLNKEKIQPSRYIELKERDVLKFGFSSRDFVLMHEDLA